jgi:hypothetical protein
MLVDDYRSSSRTKMSSHRIFDSSVYFMPKSAAQLYSRMLERLESASKPKILPFERLMENLAQRGGIRSHYTQDIDCRTVRLP